MESNPIQGNAIRTLVLLDIHPVRIVGTHLVQGQQVQDHQGQQDDGQGHHVQREEAIKGNARDQVIAANPGDDIFTKHRNRPKQRDDYLGTPVGHLAPGQHVAYEGLCHEHHKNHHAKQPDQLTGLLVGSIQQGTEHVQVDHDEEGRGSGGVHIAQHPAEIDIAHDVLDRGEGTLLTRVKTHGQPDTGQQLVDQHQQGENAKVVPEVKILRRVVLGHVGVPRAHDGQTLINPVPQSNE